MDDLLPHYNQELAFLRGHAAEFAERHPSIAGRLVLSGDVGDDPHTERLIESFALLAARIHKRLDDDFPLFTESMLEVLYPHYLRPFPSCSIARFEAGGASAQLSQSVEVPRGTLLSSRKVNDVACRFRTAYDVVLAPVRVADCSFRGVVKAPEGTTLPSDATTLLSITLELTSSQADWGELAARPLRLCLDGEASQVATLREALFGQVTSAWAQRGSHGAWEPAPESFPAEVGFKDEEALIDLDARSHPAYRLLTEYFAFPAKFNFVDITLPSSPPAGPSRSLTLHYPLSGVRADADEGRLLGTVSARNLLTGCTPVVNLFEQRADPIRVTHEAEAYTVLPDARRAHAYEVHSILKVWRVSQTPRGESVQEFKPIYSLQHESLLTEGEGAGRYWHAHRNDTVAQVSPGHETELSIVDIDFHPSALQTDTLSVLVLATNRDLPSLLQAGGAGGDLFMQGSGAVRSVQLLRRPTASVRFDRGQKALWRLISHLSLNHLSLSGGGLEALKELLRLYDLPRSPINKSVLDALVSIKHAAATTCLSGRPFPSFARGVEVTLVVDEQNFSGIGLRLFAQVMNHFYGLYVHINSFVQLTLKSARTGQNLIIFCPRSGEGPLL